jgi:hypothetical protein
MPGVKVFIRHLERLCGPGTGSGASCTRSSATAATRSGQDRLIALAALTLFAAVVTLAFTIVNV